MKTVVDSNGNKLFNIADENYTPSEGQFLVDFIPDAPPTPQELKDIAIAEIKAKYEFHRANGWSAYQDFRAMIVIDIEVGDITEQQAF